MRTRDYQAFAGVHQRRGWRHTLLTVFATLILGGLVLVLGGETAPPGAPATEDGERTVSPLPGAEREIERAPCPRSVGEDALAHRAPSKSRPEASAKDAEDSPCSAGWPGEADVGLAHPTIH